MAANQAVSGSLVSWNTVLAASESCFLHRLHWKTLRVLSAQEPRWPQAGQGSPPATARRGAPRGRPPRCRTAPGTRPRSGPAPRAATLPPMPSRPLTGPGTRADPNRTGMGAMDNQEGFYAELVFQQVDQGGPVQTTWQ